MLLKRSVPLMSSVARGLLRGNKKVTPAPIPMKNFRFFSESTDANSTDDSTTKSNTRARPRAVGHDTTNSQNKMLWYILGGAATIFGVVAYQFDFSADKAKEKLDDFVTSLRESRVTDPRPSDLQMALGPAPPPEVLTVILSLEDVITRREWDRRYGFTFELRDGVMDLLRMVAESQGQIALYYWSENTQAVGSDFMTKLARDFGTPFAAGEALGVEHMFIREGKSKQKRLEYFNRNPKSVLLVDSNPLSERMNPNNTIIVEGMDEFDARKDAALASHAPVPHDNAAYAVIALLRRLKEDASLSGGINVPQSLENLRNSAAESGFSKDMNGIFAYLSYTSELEKSREAAKLQSGLGGFYRRLLDQSPWFHGQGTVQEAAMFAPSRDPTNRLGADALVTQKYKRSLAAMFAPRS